MLSSKHPNVVDKHVGARVRQRRLMLGVSQEKLGDGLGVTFQQVQKYEKGTNRISASRIQQISNLLKVPVAFFFEDAPTQKRLDGSAPSPDFVSAFTSTSEGLALIKAFQAIERPELRRRIVRLVEEMTES